MRDRQERGQGDRKRNQSLQERPNSRSTPSQALSWQLLGNYLEEPRRNTNNYRRSNYQYCKPNRLNSYEDLLMQWSFITAVLIVCPSANVHFSSKVFQSDRLKNNLSFFSTCFLRCLHAGESTFTSIIDIGVVLVSNIFQLCGFWGSFSFSDWICINFDWTHNISPLMKI